VVPIFDAHLDLAMNAIEWNRDLTRPVEEIRAREQGMTDKPDRGRGTVSFPEMRRGRVGLCVATQIARYVAPGNPLPGWHSQEQAWAMTQAQLAWYRAMEDRGELVQIRDGAALERHLELWSTGAAAGRAPIGYVLSLEGADSLVTLGHLERAYAEGLRAVGPGHYGPGVYAFGTNACGALPAKGRELLREMERLGVILDVTHLCDESLRDALDIFRGPVWASHSNCRALVDHNRQFTDEQIRELVARGAVIGAVFDAWMLAPGWVRGRSTPQSAGVTLETVVDHIDRVCQLAGNSRHAGVGSDLDGAFGREQCPADVDTIADLADLPTRLRARGYRDEDVRNVMYGNFVAFLSRTWS
jgi:membrane dipeptidase